jgi:hypothetical protein
MKADLIKKLTALFAALFLLISFATAASIGISNSSNNISGFERIRFIQSYDAGVLWGGPGSPPNGQYGRNYQSDDLSAARSWVNARLSEGYYTIGPPGGITLVWERTGASQPFATGSNQVTLTSVALSFANATTPIADRAVFLFDNGGQMLRRLIVSGASYVPESPIVLSAGTTYWIAAEVSSSSNIGSEFSLAYHTNSASFQSTGGWTIGSYRTFSSRVAPGMSGGLAFVGGSPPFGLVPISGGWNPSQGSTRTGALIVSINGDEILVPDIGVEWPPGTSISNNLPAIPFPSTFAGQTSTDRTYVITNSGSATLSNLSLIKNGPHTDEFLVSDLLTNTLPPNATTIFRVAFRPQAIGTRSASLSVASNDPDENPFIVNLEGVCQSPPPDISVEQPIGVEITNNSEARVFPDTLACLCSGVLAPTNSSASLVYTIRNVGVGELDLSSIGFSSVSSDAFELYSTNTNFPIRLGKDQTHQITILFKPNSGGSKAGQISIASNDPDEHPFLVNLSGFGIGTNVDTDGDGLNDAAEYCMSPLGFNWKVSQTNLVQNLYLNAPLAGLYSSNAVTANPTAFGLVSVADYNASRDLGRADVTSNPMSYGLYTSNSIMDLRMGGLMLQKQGTNTVVTFQTQTTTNLTQTFTNNGPPITNHILMPGDKGFIRIRAY